MRQVERPKTCDAKYRKNLKTFAFLASRQKGKGTVFVDRVISSQFWRTLSHIFVRKGIYRGIALSPRSKKDR